MQIKEEMTSPEIFSFAKIFIYCETKKIVNRKFILDTRPFNPSFQTLSLCENLAKKFTSKTQRLKGSKWNEIVYETISIF